MKKQESGVRGWNSGISGQNPETNTPNSELKTRNSKPGTLNSILILLVALLAFALRLHALTRFQFHIDEFFTLAAAKFISQSGLPQYPTGLLYDPGLPYSYLTGLLFALFGFNEAMGRWPAVIFGTLAVVTVYWLGTRVLRSPMVGLLAALWLALSLESVEWGGRARMITLAQWLALLSAGLLYVGLTRNAARYRLGFALSYGVTLLTHFSTVVLMPAWFIAGGALWLAKAFKLRRALLRDTLVLLAGFGLVIVSGVYFQPPPSPDFAIGDNNLGDKTGELTGKFLQIPSDVGHAWETYSPYFINLPHGMLLLLALVGLAITGYRLFTGQRHQRDIGGLYFGVLFITVLVTLALIISPHWQRTRYLLMQVQGVFLLLAAHGIREIVLLIPKPRWQQATAVGLAILLTLPFLPPLESLLTAKISGWNRYDLAFKQVQDEMSGGHKVMTMHPPAALLYLEQNDYYLVQSSPKLITRPDGQPGDRYSGAVWLETAEQLSELLANSARVWLVVQEFWLFNSYDGYLQQQILFQMNKQWGEGGVWALSTRPGTWPLARDVQTPLDAQFVDSTRLAGFTANPPTPGGTLYLTLFWQGDSLPTGAKVFVHLRDAENNTVAQADHFIYDGKVPGSRWGELLENDQFIRDGATLTIPPNLQSGTYRLMVGFYHPETFQRLEVINDQSGENGVILAEWTLQ